MHNHELADMTLPEVHQASVRGDITREQYLGYIMALGKITTGVLDVVSEIHPQAILDALPACQDIAAVISAQLELGI